ncbi:MAG: MFS transporter [Desulfobacterales bacterium]|nr:MFS transporter [Desulfobacterales bacterium]
MDSYKDNYFKRNVFGVSVVEFFWGLGFPIVLESTFLQLFLKNLGASSFVIGLVPALFVVGISCFPLFSSYLSSFYRLKKTLVLLLHLISALSILIFGLTLLVMKQSEHVLLLFFASYTIFSICMGLTIPVWLNYLVRIFSESKTVPGLGYMMLAQNIGKVVSSLFILKVVDRYSFSLSSSAWVFVCTGLVFIVGSLCFIITKEIADSDDPSVENLSFFHHTRSSFVEISRNRRFLIFLIADLDFYVIITVLSFYANYATGFYQVADAIAAGLFVACIYAGSITVNIFLGAMNLLGLKQKFILSKCVTLMLLMMLIFFPSYITFFLISYMLGFVRAIRNMVYPPSVKKFADKTDATSYFALAPIITLPITAGYPLVFGKMLDYLHFMQEDSYKLLFGFSALFILITVYFTIKTDYEEAKSTDNEMLSAS